MGVEIEKKFLVKELPKGLEEYPFHVIEQGYLNVFPAIRVRREDDVYYMTYKGDISPDDGFGVSNAGNVNKIGKTEYNLPLDKASYEHLVKKADGNMIRKKRYLIPLNEDAFPKDYLEGHPKLAQMIADREIKTELDVFGAPFEGRILAEVEFPDEETAAAYRPADWFAEEVTGDVRYSNARMSTEKI
jgi:CYTH domain-containing protein